MKRSIGIYIVIVGMALPLIWLAATTDFAAGARGPLILGGGLLTYAWLVKVVWSAHMRGAFIPNRCLTCDRPMSIISGRQVKPPPSKRHEAGQQKWRCGHCGRLV